MRAIHCPTSTLLVLLLLGCVGVARVVPAQETVEDEAALEDLAGLMQALPPPPGPTVRREAPPPAGEELAAGIHLQPGRVVLSGTAIFDAGPVDGLEVVACLKGGKNHEALMWLESDRADLVKAAFIAAFDVHDGAVSPEASSQPARGTPLQLKVFWQHVDPLAEGPQWRVAHASELVRSRQTNRAYPPLPYIYTGSQIRTIVQTLPDGSVRRVERFMLADTKSVAVNFDEPDCLLASPYPLSARDDSFEVNTGLQPPAPKSPVVLVAEPAQLPLSLRAAADGGLRREGQVLDDDAVTALLRETYGSGDAGQLAAVGVVVDAEVPRAIDQVLRRRILALAAAARVWVVPVFVLEPPADGAESAQD